MYTYLFDFDGTLVDSMPTYVHSMLRILDENNISYEPEIMKIITPLGIAGTAEYFMGMGLTLSKEEIMNAMKEYMLVEYTYNIQAKKNVIKTLKTLKERGAKLNVLTASPHITLDARQCHRQAEVERGAGGGVRKGAGRPKERHLAA